jgi:hypothetical protein
MATSTDIETVKNWIVGGNIGIKGTRRGKRMGWGNFSLPSTASFVSSRSVAIGLGSAKTCGGT